MSEYKEGKDAVKNFFTPEKLSTLLDYLMIDHSNLDETKKAF